MNGLLVLSLNSGMLLFDKEYTRNFGVQGDAGSNALQLSSLCFALYQTSRTESKMSALARQSAKNSSESSGLRYIKQGSTLFTFTPYAAGGDEIAQIGDSLDTRYLLVLLLDSAISTDAAIMLGSAIVQTIRNSVLHKAGIVLPLKQSHINKLNDRLSAAFLKGLSLLYNRKMRSDEFSGFNLLWLYRIVGRSYSINRKIESHSKARAYNWIRKEMGMQFNSAAFQSSIEEIRGSEKAELSKKSSRKGNIPIKKEPSANIIATEDVKSKSQSDEQEDDAGAQCCICWSTPVQKPLPQINSQECVVIRKNAQMSEMKEEIPEKSSIPAPEKRNTIFSILKLELLSARHVPQSRSALEQEKEKNYEQALLLQVEQIRSKSIAIKVHDQGSIAALAKIGVRQEFEMTVSEEKFIHCIRERSAAVCNVSHTSAFSQDLEAFGSSSKNSSVNSSPNSRKYSQSNSYSTSWKHQQVTREDSLKPKTETSHLGGWAQMAQMTPVSGDNAPSYGNSPAMNLHVVAVNDVVLVYTPRTYTFAAAQSNFTAALAKAGSGDDQSVDSLPNQACGNTVTSLQYLTDLTLWSRTCIDHVRPMMNKMRQEGAVFLDLGWIHEF